MHQHAATAPITAAHDPRTLFDIAGAQPGPTTIIFTGIHANEPAGRIAAANIAQQLDQLRPHIRGRIVALIGNLAATPLAVRFIDADLNRAFSLRPLHRDEHDASILDRLIETLPPDAHERTERDHLLTAIDDILAEHDPRHEAHAIDLHTFSADGPPFVVFADTLRNRRFATALPLPLVLGLVEEIQGTLSDLLSEAGLVSIVVEAGQHDDPEAPARVESALRILLVRAGHIDPSHLPTLAPTLEEDRARLASASSNHPRVLDIHHRHALAEDHRFVMRPGFRNLDPIRSNQHLADDRDTPVHAPAFRAALIRGRPLILLPLYQRQGSDGFFIARPISRFWLALSSFLRRINADRIAPLLPGVRRHPAFADTLTVDRRIARFVATEIFHLLGYRITHRDQRSLIVARRAHDLHAPASTRLKRPAPHESPRVPPTNTSGQSPAEYQRDFAD